MTDLELLNYLEGEVRLDPIGSSDMIANVFDLYRNIGHIFPDQSPAWWWDSFTRSSLGRQYYPGGWPGQERESAGTDE